MNSFSLFVSLFGDLGSSPIIYFYCDQLTYTLQLLLVSEKYQLISPGAVIESSHQLTG